MLLASLIVGLFSLVTGYALAYALRSSFKRPVIQVGALISLMALILFSAFVVPLMRP